MIAPAVRLARETCLTGLLALCGVAAAGEIYKSVDANGNVVYSDHLESPTTQSSIVNLSDSANPLQTSAAPAGSTVNSVVAPPPLPPEDQPPVPEPDDQWVPGYWNWQDPGYVWVPGNWAVAPRVGYLWTPAWWVLAGSYYVFHAGYWGPTVGYYGGINYGHGYDGHGFNGGRWVGSSFAYNSSVTHLGPNVRNQYAESPANGGPRSTASFKPGPAPATTVATVVAHEPQSRSVTGSPAGLPAAVPHQATTAPGAQRVPRTVAAAAPVNRNTTPAAPAVATAPKPAHAAPARAAVTERR